MVNANADKDYGIDECTSTSELPENKLRHNFRLGDITWVKKSDSSWWPAQVIDEACVGGKPKKKTKHDCLVRLYGTCQYLCVDPWKSNTEFKMMLKQENKSAMEAFHEVLEKELSSANLSSDYDEEGVNSKVTVQKGKRGCARQSSCTHDKEQAIDQASSENSAEGLRNKKRKQIARVLDKEDCKIGASVVRREGLRRSGCTNENKHLNAAEDRTAPFTEIGASEDATEDSTADGTSAPHAEIKALVRDILFKEIIDREHDAEMAYVDDVINGICNATEDGVTGGATASTKGESSNVTRRHRKEKLDQGTKDTMQVTSRETVDHTTPGCSNEGTGNT